ncbi:MAG: hypothetical protein LBB80_01835 [Treponema sp.]|jgi:hypothetical protein|nr:hypothetical protein [Treponema sp.]
MRINGVLLFQRSENTTRFIEIQGGISNTKAGKTQTLKILYQNHNIRIGFSPAIGKRRKSEVPINSTQSPEL